MMMMVVLYGRLFRGKIRTVVHTVSDDATIVLFFGLSVGWGSQGYA
jgi:hypothetical protein